MNHEALVSVQGAMFGALMSYPVGQLAYAAAWLKPIDPDETNPTVSVLHHLCRWIPDAYLRCIEYMRTGCTEQDLDDFICGEINRFFGDDVVLDLEVATYGLDFPMLGIDIWDPEFWQNEGMDRVHTALGHFGLFAFPDADPDDESQEGIQPEDGALRQAGDVCHYLYQDLEDRQGVEFDHLRCLLDWMFSRSGNTILDYSSNAYYESGITPPDWDDFKLATGVWFEAVELHQKAVKGMELIEGSTAWLTALLDNIHTIWKRMKKGRRDINGHYTGLRFKPFDWPEPTPGEETIDGAVVL